MGTYLLVLFGTGSIAAAILTDAQVGLWQVAVVWGFGVTLAIYSSAALSGAHLNPAVSLAFALFRRHDFPLVRLFPYIAAQLLGAILAGATVAALFWPFLTRFEALNGIVRGTPGSELSAMVFGEYFPNPAMFGTGANAHALVSPVHAVLVEGFGTAVLVFVIFAPITQAGWNPARDFGPRVVSFALGWGDIAIPGPRSGFWVYIVGPLLGGPLGGAVWQLVGFEGGPAARAPALEVAGPRHTTNR